MKSSDLFMIATLSLLLVPGCTSDSATDEGERLEVRTIDNSPTELRTIQKPPMIEFDEGPAPELIPDEVNEAPVDENKARASNEKDSAQWTQNLPFSPKIAMDPVDGSKLSIRRTTPIAEYKSRIYYFSSEANRREFIRSPDDYLSGKFAAY